MLYRNTVESGSVIQKKIKAKVLRDQFNSIMNGTLSNGFDNATTRKSMQNFSRNGYVPKAGTSLNFASDYGQ